MDICSELSQPYRGETNESMNDMEIYANLLRQEIITCKAFSSWKIHPLILKEEKKTIVTYKAVQSITES